MAQANTVSDAVKSALPPSVVEGFQGLAADVGGEGRASKGRWVKFAARFAELSKGFPRLEGGSIDRESDQCREAREVFVAGAIAALTGGTEYDRPLHRAGDDEFHVPSADRPANYTLTGRSAVAMDSKTLAALPSLVENPLGQRRFIESTRKTLTNTATQAWGRFFKSEFAERTGRGPTATIDEWIDGLAKPMTAKLGKARTDGRKVATNDGAKKALAQFRKALLG